MDGGESLRRNIEIPQAVGYGGAARRIEVRVVHFANSDITSSELVFVVLQNPESQDRDIARDVHFVNSDIASWEAVFVVLQNPKSRDHEIAELTRFMDLDIVNQKAGSLVSQTSEP
jgi:hypothetical protein